MPKTSKSKFWLDLITKIANLFFKNLNAKTRKKTHNQHVVPHDIGWAVRGEGNEKYTATYKYQDDAIRRAKDIAQNNKSDVIIHRKNGTIRDRISYE